MERFCSKCGTLVEGEGKFCPSCGAVLESAVNLDKPAPSVEPMQPAPPPSNPYTGSNPYTSSNSAQMPSYPQSYNSNNYSSATQEMSVGQWVLTIFLSALSIVGLILLFIWAFGDTPQPKKNYARAMLIWQAIALGITILYIIGLFSCVVGGIGSGDFDDIFRNMQYY